MKRVLMAVLACWLLLAPAGGQVLSLFYQEVEKDGRVYVFNTPEGFAQWEKTGEMGKSITLIGAGAKGETIVAENETALDLYLFKHGLPGYRRPTPKPEKLPFEVSWKDGKTTIKTKASELTLSNRMQVRFTQLQRDQGSDVPSFRIRRFKTKLEGWAYSRHLRYELQLNWPDSRPLEDANISFDFTKGKGLLAVKAGQFKVPFGRQELTSSGNQQFVDRSIVSTAFALGRDIGLELSGVALGGQLEWRAGVFNGAGRNVTANDDNKLQADARVSWQPLGTVKLTEGDLEASSKPLFALAAQLERNGRVGGSNLLWDKWGTDAVWLWKGLFLFGEFFRAEHSPESGPKLRREGWNLQAGYALVPKRLELAWRYAELDPSIGTPRDQQREKGLAVGYFFNRHAHKLQADLRQLENRRTNQKDWEFRVQYQLIF